MGNEYMNVSGGHKSSKTFKQQSNLITDIKALVKSGVLIANALPVFAGFWLALHFTDASFGEFWGSFLLTMAGSTLVMAGALILNNWYDSDIDTVMDRTKHRPTVTGSFSLKTVLRIGIGATIAGFILLLFTTWETVFYTWIGWFTYVVLYTMWSKRRYTLNTVIGSISGAVTPLIGWSAVDSAIHIVPLTLFLLLFIWQIPHTFAIAIRKHDEYKAAGVKMLPVVHGMDVTKRQMTIYVATLLPLPFLLPALGVPFMVIVTILNAAWLVLSIRGLFTDEHRKWAYWNFLYSVNYLTIVFMLSILVTLPIFD
ncbi:heme o synthase [Virgibacillus xinjiangensis]|uniref:Protoheme IX farnesyltransferase n=1 Tax=Virgibacillus xinjiangensis TaxID=393090 RepID=A0ABV7CWK3_9BACI